MSRIAVWTCLFGAMALTVLDGCSTSEDTTGQVRSFAEPRNCLEVSEAEAETEGCCTNARITEDAANEQRLDVVWTGFEHGVAYERDQMIYFLLIDDEAHTLVDPTPVSTVLESGYAPAIEWNGAEYGIVWEDARDVTSQIYFASVEPETMQVGPEIQLTTSTNGAHYADLAWNGNEYGVVWEDLSPEGMREIYFTRLDAQGNRIAQDAVVTPNAADSSAPQIVWNDNRNEYGFVWSDDRYQDVGHTEVFFARIDTQGALIGGSEVRVSDGPGDSVDPHIAWNGRFYGITWRDRRDFIDGRVFFSALTHDGSFANAETPELPMTDGHGAVFVGNIASNGDVFVMVWNELRMDGAFDEIFFAVAHPTAGIRQPPTRLSYLTGMYPATGFQRVTFNRADFSVFWFDGRNGGNDIYMGRVASNGACR